MIAWSVRRAPVETYHWCQACDLIAKDPSLRLSKAEEEIRYELHSNGDEGHRRFLSPVVEAVKRYVQKSEARGLDWGSGPVPVLGDMLRESHFQVDIYDPQFHPEPPDSNQFDFMTSTEVVEHFHEAGAEWMKLLAPLRPDGVLVIMTERHQGQGFMNDWHYRRDPTHVSFYSDATFRHFEALFGLKLLEILPRIAVFRKAQTP